MIGRVALLITFKKDKPKPQSLSRSHIRDLAVIYMGRIKFLIVLIFCFQTTFAHQDFWQVKQYDNIITRVISGFDFEEVHKVKLIGQMTRDLCDSLNFTDTIVLDFKHAYTGPIKSTYFIGVHDSLLNYNSDEPYHISHPIIIITEHGSSFDFESTLKLVEYSISNKKKISKSQKKTETVLRHSFFDLYTISTRQTEEIVQGKTSNLVESVLSNKYWREVDFERPLIKCYWSNGEYYFEAIRYNNSDTLIFKTKSIYFSQYFEEAAFIYINDSCFIFLNGNNPSASKKHLIEDKGKVFEYMPLKFVKINRYNFACSISYYSPNANTWEEAVTLLQRTLYYQVNNDRLIQNLEEEI
jgi:hypothetical protein